MLHIAMIFCVFDREGVYHGSLTTMGGKFSAERLDESTKKALDWEHCIRSGVPYLRPMGLEDGLAMVLEQAPLDSEDFTKAFLHLAGTSGLETIPLEGEKVQVWQRLLSNIGEKTDAHRYARALRLWPETELDAFNVALA